ncbi:ABC transporter permease [Naumannella halotolerans]|uniref:Oligopeptide transport system permease protein n=1 Tax=Naumannella halotolerans TaxID=993414 RepID=A0A4V3EN65_9ACTN|nr:ABC transporter permease [Naumannella halotolerans]TDT32658.1 oligopeptide transport system permease protein [Naumannella halotolerans]
MLTFIIRRLLQLIPVFLGTTFLIFAMVYGLGDPTAGRCGERPCPASYVARLTEEYHLDDPLIVQYGYYMLGLLQGDLGTTFNGQNVGEELLLRYPTTIKLALIALVFEAVIGIVAGVLAGIYRGSFLDYLVTVSSLVVISIPIFVLGGMAQLVFGIMIPDATGDRLGLPATATDGTWYQLLMPGLVLGSVSVAYIARLLRASLVENLRADYVRTAKAKGLGRGRVIGVHTMRNSLIPVITFIGTDIGALMGGAVVTERIFNVNGIGGYLFRSITTKQGAAVVGTITVLVVVYLLANLLVDVLYGYLDPRISHD